MKLSIANGIRSRAASILVIVSLVTPESAVGEIQETGECTKGSYELGYPPSSDCANQSCFLGAGCNDICVEVTWTDGSCNGPTPACTIESQRVAEELCRACECPLIGLAVCEGGARYADYGFWPYTFGKECEN